MRSLENKIAVITGGARGQGASEARLLAKEGASVIICDLLQPEGEQVAAHIRSDGDDATFVKLNVSRKADWDSLSDFVETKHGRLDILINNAGITHRAGIVETDIDDLATQAVELAYRAESVTLRVIGPAARPV